MTTNASTHAELAAEINADGPDRIRLADGTTVSDLSDVPDSEPLARIGVGDVLPNGHTVVAVEPLPHDRNGVVVLAVRRGEYATWVALATAPHSTVSGHYHGASILTASIDFCERAGLK